MFEHHYAGCYWFSRSESAQESARRAEALFRGLSGCDLLFTRWFEQGTGLEDSRKRELDPSAETFLKLFARQENQVSDRCFRVWVWNGQDDDTSIGVNFKCGVIGSQLPGSCVITFPCGSPSAERLLTADVLSQVLRCMVTAWDPDWGVATSSQHRSLVSATATVGTFPGWLMYFPCRPDTVPPLPEPVRVEPVNDKGTLVILTPERFTVENPAHVELAARAGESLKQAGMLKLG